MQFLIVSSDTEQKSIKSIKLISLMLHK